MFCIRLFIEITDKGYLRIVEAVETFLATRFLIFLLGRFGVLGSRGSFGLLSYSVLKNLLSIKKENTENFI